MTSQTPHRQEAKVTQRSDDADARPSGRSGVPTMAPGAGPMASGLASASRAKH
ncbi:hypothetical protein PJI17_16175 [Mycobacterium kansasii]